jgi:PleD family two-component response regulator
MHNTRPILLIEDDCIDMMTVERALKEHCVEVELVHVIHGEQALEYLRSGSGERPSVILLNLHAPKMDGLDFLEVVKADESLRDIPVVVFSGSNEEEVMNKAFELGASDYIVKSTEYREFCESFGSIERFLEGCKRATGKGVRI